MTELDHEVAAAEIKQLDQVATLCCVCCAPTGEFHEKGSRSHYQYCEVCERGRAAEDIQEWGRAFDGTFTRSRNPDTASTRQSGRCQTCGGTSFNVSATRQTIQVITATASTFEGIDVIDDFVRIDPDSVATGMPQAATARSFRELDRYVDCSECGEQYFGPFEIS